MNTAPNPSAGGPLHDQRSARLIWWGERDYPGILGRQDSLHEARRLDQVADHWLAGEHPAVFTRGIRSTDADLPDGLAERVGARVVTIDRGGMTTLHSPGQFVLYPIVKLAAGSIGAGAFSRALIGFVREWMHEAYGVEGGLIDKRPGLYVEGRKLASIGLSGRGGVTMHGVAINVCNDLALWEGFIACGDPAGRPVSLAELIGRTVAPFDLFESLTGRLAAAWGYQEVVVSSLDDAGS